MMSHREQYVLRFPRNALALQDPRTPEREGRLGRGASNDNEAHTHSGITTHPVSRQSIPPSILPASLRFQVCHLIHLEALDEHSDGMC